MGEVLRKPRQFRGEAFFRKVLAERGPGVSLHELARRNGVSGSVLCRWAHKLGVGGRVLADGADTSQRVTARRRPRAPARRMPGLVPVTIATPRPAATPVSGFVVELRCGRAVRVPPCFSGEELARLIAVVETAPC